MKKIVLTFVLLIVLVLSGCAKEEPAEVLRTNDVELAKEPETANEAEPANEPAEPERDKILAPDFTLLNKAGEEVTLSDYRGKIVFLNFFTTWCTYCEAEMPDFQEASVKYADDVEFLIVDVFTSESTDEAGVYEWYESRGFTMEMVIDKEGILNQYYPVQGFPTTFFIDREGYVIAYYPGAMTPDIIDEVVTQFK